MSSASDSDDDLFMSHKAREKTSSKLQLSAAQESAENAINKQIIELQKAFIASKDVEVVKNNSDPFKIKIITTPSRSYWKGQKIKWNLILPRDFPYSCPEVTCLTQIWHPNIDLTGKPCISVLHKGWTPLTTLKTLVSALLFLLHEPNSNDSLNHQAAQEMKTDTNLFIKHIEEYNAANKPSYY